MKDYSERDVKFAMEMIRHHEMAVSSAADEITLGENTEVKAMARSIFTGQREEIAKFREWLRVRNITDATKKHGAM